MASDQHGQVKPAAVARSVFFQCSGCGKKLKAKADSAQKKVKCHKCDKAVLVPAAEAVESNVCDVGL
jgi:DNA-directed RNA polymerase subunit RPC12/RpoP